MGLSLGSDTVSCLSFSLFGKRGLKRNQTNSPHWSRLIKAPERLKGNNLREKRFENQKLLYLLWHWEARLVWMAVVCGPWLVLQGTVDSKVLPTHEHGLRSVSHSAVLILFLVPSLQAAFSHRSDIKYFINMRHSYQGLIYVLLQT